jgi:hypothetical protein
MSVPFWADHGFLPRRGAGGALSVWPPSDLQHGSGVPVHQAGVHRALADQGIPISMDGTLARQGLRGTAVAEPQR